MLSKFKKFQSCNIEKSRTSRQIEKAWKINKTWKTVEVDTVENLRNPYYDSIMMNSWIMMKNRKSQKSRKSSKNENSENLESWKFGRSRKVEKSKSWNIKVWKLKKLKV